MTIDKKAQGRSNKRKGSRVERQIVHLHRDIGYVAKRVPLSGQLADYKGDVLVDLPDGVLQAEIKARKKGSGFTTIDKWLGDNDILFLKRDQRRPAVYMNWDTYKRLLELIKGDTPSE